MAKIYLVDSENVGASWSQLLPSLSGEDKMYVFYTDKSPYISYENLLQVIAYCNIPVFIKCHEGKNALDFQLVSELGFKLCQSPEAEFFIVSDDYGYDAAVKYWSGRKYNVHRVTKKFCRPMQVRKHEETAEVHAESFSQQEAVPDQVQETVTDQVQEAMAQDTMAQDAAAAYVDKISRQALAADQETEPRQEAELLQGTELRQETESQKETESWQETEPASEQTHPWQEHFQQDNQSRKQARDRKRRHRREAVKETTAESAEPETAELKSAELKSAERKSEELKNAEPKSAEQAPTAQQDILTQTGIADAEPKSEGKMEAKAEVKPKSESRMEAKAEALRDDEKQSEAEPQAAERFREAFTQPAQKERRRRNPGRRQKSEKPGAEGERQSAEEGTAADGKVQAVSAEAPAAEKRQEAFSESKAVKPQAAEGAKGIPQETALEAAADKKPQSVLLKAEEERPQSVSLKAAEEEKPQSVSLKAEEEKPQAVLAEAAVELSQAEAAEAQADQSAEEEGKENTASKAELLLLPQILTILQKWESPQPEKDAKCVLEMFRTLNMGNLTVVNTALTVLTGIDLGNNIYRELKEHQECRAQLDSLYMASQKDRFMHYVQIVLDRSGLEGITADEIGKFLLRIPRKNLNSIRSNMLKEFGHEKGAEIYSVYKPHIKVLNKI